MYKTAKCVCFSFLFFYCIVVCSHSSWYVVIILVALCVSVYPSVGDFCMRRDPTTTHMS